MERDCEECLHRHFSENNVDFLDWMRKNHFDVINKYRDEYKLHNKD